MKSLSNQNKYESQKCIWMTAGVIEYKLCNNSFNCETCHLDSVFRVTKPEGIKEKYSQGIPDENYIHYIIRRIKSVPYTDCYLNLENQFVLRNIFRKTYYLGLNQIMNLLIDENTQIEFINTEQIVKKGDDFIFLKGKWGNKIIKSPLNFTILGSVNKIIKDTSWCCLVEIEDESFEDAIQSKHTYRHYNNELISLLAKSDLSSVAGVTLNDGGKMLTSIPEIIGADEYNNILALLFQY